MALMLLMPLSAQAQPEVGFFDGYTNVGSVKLPGSVVYDAERQEYIVEGAGANMWFDSDEFYFVWKRLSGDFILRTHARFLSEGVDPHRKLGWIIRSSLDSSAAYVDAAVHGDGLTAMQFRRVQGGDTEEIQAPTTAPDVIQLERNGDTYIMSVARFGDEFERTELRGVDLPDDVYVGLFVSSHNEDVIEKAAFSNVRIVLPPAEGDVAYQDYIGSNLEIMDVETGHRQILHRIPESLQAPNWTTDGKALIYNHNGLLYRFDLETRQPEVIDTDFATRNNNDHVISFDGTMLAISHHPEEHDRQSIIYTVPIEGGTPKKVTNEGPSYLHGWSPDGRFLTYTAQRGGDYDIYVIPVEGGEEIRLTDTPGLDDGSEYSPDGEYIYYNSVRSGSMELWRMRPDGTEHEQLTDDELNNWFPHISPDGERIVFISYLPDVAPDDHPFYKQVYLRSMPVDGGEPKVIAYLFGGQGTINVPSWSPDGTRIAFVSNSDLGFRD